MKRRHKIIIIALIIVFILPGFLNHSYSKTENEFSIPVLMYHSITKDEKGLFKVPKDKFYEQMKYLKDNNYKTLTLDELYNHLINGIPFPEKSIVITFDDGYSDNYENAYPILKKFGFKATIFTITNYIANKDGTYFMSKDQLKELELNGVEIESHTTNHPKLDKLSKEERIKTLKNSKDTIEKLLNKEVKYIAYPFGRCNEDVIEDVKNVGYNMAFTTKMGLANMSSGVYELKRVFINGYTNLNRFAKKIGN